VATDLAHPVLVDKASPTIGRTAVLMPLLGGLLTAEALPAPRKLLAPAFAPSGSPHTAR
jgi:hypothetical protein